MQKPLAPPSPRDLAAGLRRWNSQTNLDEDKWRPAYDAALGLALQDGDVSQFVEVVEVGLNRLDARGRHDELVALIDSALGLLGDEPDESRVLLLGIRATVERALARASAAHETFASANLLRARVADGDSVRRFDVDRAVYLMSALQREPSVERLIRERLAGKHYADAALLMTWNATLWLARGHPSRARPWVQFLAATSNAQGHIWRVADAASLQYAIDVRTYRGSEVGTVFDVGNNWVARRRLITLDLHAALTRRNFDSADAHLDELASVKRSNPAQRAGEEGFAALVSVCRGASPPPIRPPGYVGLENVGAILAGAEAVALGGSLELVATWRRWLSADLPADIVTAADWPTSRHRIEGLLALREGDEASAFRHFAAAVASAESEHYEIEADLSRVQIAEVAGAPRDVEVWERLRSGGIDGAAFGYWVASCRRIARAHRQTEISERELQILRLAADGMSAKATAQRLGLSARTVSNHLQRAYEKLGAHTRVQAIGLARAAGLL